MKIPIAALLFAVVACIAMPAEATFKSIYTFCATDCLDGTQPTGTPVMDASGRIYGVATYGGQRIDGSVFMLVPRGPQGRLKFEQIYEFCDQPCPAGRYPAAGLVVDTAGNLYGVTTVGPSIGRGTVFELTPNRRKTEWTLKVLYAFCPSGSNCTDGDTPSTRLTYAGQASGAPYDGTSPLYGTTGRGGSANDGTVYRLTPDGEGGWLHSVVYSFCQQSNCTDGGVPVGDLTMDGSGNIFGTAQGGGAKGQGVVFELAGGAGHRAWSFTVLHDFCSLAGCDDGGYPATGVTLDGAGHLFGTAQGGPTNFGLIYELTPQGNGSPYEVRYEFCRKTNCRDGDTPINPLLVDNSGNVFGATEEGGANGGAGTVFELDTSGRLNVLHTFCTEGGACSNGAVPDGGLMMDGAGRLIGTTQYGGAATFDRGGTIFAVTP